MKSQRKPSPYFIGFVGELAIASKMVQRKTKKSKCFLLEKARRRWVAGEEEYHSIGATFIRSGRVPT
jgi:hypothetical protein